MNIPEGASFKCEEIRRFLKEANSMNEERKCQQMTKADIVFQIIRTSFCCRYLTLDPSDCGEFFQIYFNPEEWYTVKITTIDSGAGIIELSKRTGI